MKNKDYNTYKMTLAPHKDKMTYKFNTKDIRDFIKDKPPQEELIDISNRTNQLKKLDNLIKLSKFKRNISETLEEFITVCEELKTILFEMSEGIAKLRLEAFNSQKTNDGSKE